MKGEVPDNLLGAACPSMSGCDASHAGSTWSRAAANQFIHKPPVMLIAWPVM